MPGVEGVMSYQRERAEGWWSGEGARWWMKWERCEAVGKRE